MMAPHAMTDATPPDSNTPDAPSGARNLLEVFSTALKLGLMSFGGPIAHIGYFRDEYVGRKQWLSEREFADIVALAQVLPGPASSQVGMAVGQLRGGILGALIAWFGFTMPSAIALILFAYGVTEIGDVADAGWLHGLKVVVVAVVALAVWGMAKTLAPDAIRGSIAIAAAISMLLVPGFFWQVGIIAIGAAVGYFILHTDEDSGEPPRAVGHKRIGVVAIFAFFALLIALPIASELTDDRSIDVIDGMYSSGSLVFGGGHVVLPLIQAETVEPGLLTEDQFLAGYGATQAVPGPLFTFSAYLGSVIDFSSARWVGGLIALGAIFLPSFLLVVGVMPYWPSLRANQRVRRALLGVNAVVVGILLAALYDPIWTTAIRDEKDISLALGAFGLLALLRWPPWIVVALAAGGGQAIAWL
jgi:chromate transporter